MAEQVPSPQGTSGPASFRTHDWHPYDSYVNIHYSYMERFERTGLVLRDGMSFYEIEGPNGLFKVNVRGRVVCVDGVLIKVDKWLDVRLGQRQLEVKGSDYAYHAWLRSTRRNLIRYCSAHGLDDLHCHHYDLLTGEEISRPNVALAELPTLGDFIVHAVRLGRMAQGISF